MIIIDDYIDKIEYIFKSTNDNELRRHKLYELLTNFNNKSKEDQKNIDQNKIDYLKDMID